MVLSENRFGGKEWTPGMGLVGIARLAFLDLAVRKALPCLLAPPMVAPKPPGPIDFIVASAVSLSDLGTSA